MCNCKNYADTFLKYFLVSIPNQLNILKTFHKSLKTTIIMKLAKLHTSQLKFSLLRDSCNRHYWSQYLLFFLVLITGKFRTWLTLYLIRVGNYKSSLFWEIMIKIGYYLDCYISFSSTRWTHYLKNKQIVVKISTHNLSEYCTIQKYSQLGKKTEQSQDTDIIY